MLDVYLNIIIIKIITHYLLDWNMGALRYGVIASLNICVYNTLVLYNTRYTRGVIVYRSQFVTYLTVM